MNSPKILYLQIFMPGFLVRIRGCWMPPLAGYSKQEALKKNGISLRGSRRTPKTRKSNKGIELAINYEHDYIESYVKTDYFNTFCSKIGLDSQLMIDFCKNFASHIDSSKE